MRSESQKYSDEATSGVMAAIDRHCSDAKLTGARRLVVHGAVSRAVELLEKVAVADRHIGGVGVVALRCMRELIDAAIRAHEDGVAVRAARSWGAQ